MEEPLRMLLKQAVTIRLDRETLEYFRALAVKTGLSYQSLVNLYLRDCAMRRKEVSLQWALAGRRTSA